MMPIRRLHRILPRALRRLVPVTFIGYAFINSSTFVLIGPGRTTTVLLDPMALRSEVCGLTDGVVVSHRFAVA